jgi:hypothetical protein
MNRAEAIAAGVARYAGKVCAKHPDQGGIRYVCNFGCVQCSLNATLKNLGTESGKQTRRAYLQTDAGRAMMKKARKRTPRPAPKWPDRKTYQAAYRKAKQAEIAASKRVYKAMRESRVSKHATPPWADKAAIAATYAAAKMATQETGVPHVVDHFYPLAGKVVCGLHVQGNLRVITSHDNLKKNNRMPVEG